MDIYVFSSRDLTNIWAAIGAKKWAVSIKQSNNPSILTKSKNLPIGSFGLFYCVKEKCLTTPFVIRSKPSQEETIDNIWDKTWALPFSIIPLGSPNNRLDKDKLKQLLPYLKNNRRSWDKIFFVGAMMVFTPSKIPEEDWGILINSLV
ncbi:MAG: hypothetical protein AB1424_09630 [Thermodesulfobacteriota bacterium]